MLGILRLIFGKKTTKKNKASARNIKNSTVAFTQVNAEKIENLVLLGKEDIPIDFGTKNPLYLTGTLIDSKKSDKVNHEIDKTGGYINSNRIEEAKEELYRILGKIDENKDSHKKEMARIYNNLGVCFNRPSFLNGDFDKALGYFKLAFEYDSSLKKAQSNLANVFINKGGPEDFEKAYNLTQDLWKEKGADKTLILPVLLLAICNYQSLDSAIEWFEKNEDAQAIAKEDESSLLITVELYVSKGNLKEAQRYADYGLKLFPTSPKIKYLKSKTLLAKAQKDKIIPSYFSIVPKFDDYQDIEEALLLLEEAARLVGNSDKFLESLIKLDIVICSIWLNRAHDAKYKAIKDSINISILAEEQIHILDMYDVDRHFKERNFPAALLVIENSENWGKASHEEKRRIAHIFLLQSAVEQAEKLLRPIEQIADRDRDVEFWFDISLVDIYLENKNLAIKEAEKAKNYAKGTNLEKKALSHFNAVMMRYARMGEVDRLMDGMFEYNNKYPEDKALMQIKAIDDKGQLTDDLKDVLLKQKERYENIKKQFKEQPLPTYCLEAMCKKPYIEIISMGIDNGDTEFTVDFTPSSQEAMTELSDNFNSAKTVIFDYSALLNLAKMDLLGILDKFNKKICIVENLFDKIQEELLSTEREDLRKLWNFLRKSSVIQIITDIPSVSFELEKISNFLGEWLVESIKLAKSKNLTFISDDLRLLMYLKSDSIKGSNTYALLKAMKKKEFIDDKIYALSLGDLAERSYVFISFSGNDLFHIVMEDKAKLTYRSYHLINHIFLPNSNINSFMGVFIRFIFLLWRTGSLPEEKISWITLFSNVIKKLIDEIEAVEPLDEKKALSAISGFGTIWRIGIAESSKDELLLMEKATDEIFDKSYLKRSLPKIKEYIKKRIEAVSK